MQSPALAVIEFSSIAVGMAAGDAMAKQAVLAGFRTGTIQPGRLLIVITGSVADVDESYRAGLRVGGDTVIDRLYLADAHAAVHAAVAGRRSAPTGESLGIIETCTVAVIVHAADAAVKAAAVTLRELRLGDGLGGKGLVHLDGDLADVQAAIAAGEAVIAPREIEYRKQVIPAVDALVLGELSATTRYHR